MLAAGVLSRCWLIAAMVFLLLPTRTLAAELIFPELTGRVVDEADILSSTREAELTRLLEEHERETTNQVVVVTVNSLQGVPIADFGKKLGTHWGIGQKDKDNGVLLVVAPNEREVHIAVGRGLETTLTDRLAKDIIDNRILPQFRSDNMAVGINEGTIAILQVLEGSYKSKRRSSEAKRKDDSTESGGWLSYLLVPVIWLINLIRGGNGKSGGGGFSGGGGSFGGGGASGGW